MEPPVNTPASENRPLPAVTPIQPGRYQHYKGNEYLVLEVARHSESLEELVVYRQDYGERGLWVRPRCMFDETIEINGVILPRFRYLGPA